MAFNEKSARKIIKYLLEEDVYDFSRWLPEIEKFNKEEIEKLYRGEIDYKYPIKNKKIFEKLVYKFDNFEKLILEWYTSEEKYKYLKQLWIKYICIEDIKEKLSNEKNDEKLTNFLEKKDVNYSDWPNEIKEEFKKCIEKTNGTLIHEEEIKKKLNEEHSIFKNSIFKTMNETVTSFKKSFQGIEELAKKKFQENYSHIIKTVVLGISGLAAISIIPCAGNSIEKKITKRSLKNQIRKYISNKTVIKKVAKDIMNKYFGSEITNLTWGIGNFFFDGDEVDGFTDIEDIEDLDVEMDLDLSDKANVNLSLFDHLSTIFKNKMILGLVGFASLSNLGFSVLECNEIKNIIEKIDKNNYRNEFNKIKESFRQHSEEIDLSGDAKYYLDRIQYVKTNIDSDKKKLTELLVKIEADINLLEQHKKDSFYGLISSSAFGIISILGTLSTGGISSGLYLLFSAFNVVSFGKDIKSISSCSEKIDELKKLQKEVEEEKKKMDNILDDLNLKIKQKDNSFPGYIEKIDELAKIQNKMAKNYLFNKNIF